MARTAGLKPAGQKEKATGFTPAGRKGESKGTQAHQSEGGRGTKTIGTGKGTSTVLGKTRKSALTPKSDLGESPLKGSKSALSTGRTSKATTRGTPPTERMSELSKSSRNNDPMAGYRKHLQV